MKQYFTKKVSKLLFQNRKIHHQCSFQTISYKNTDSKFHASRKHFGARGTHIKQGSPRLQWFLEEIGNKPHHFMENHGRSCASHGKYATFSATGCYMPLGRKGYAAIRKAMFTILPTAQTRNFAEASPTPSMPSRQAIRKSNTLTAHNI